MRLIHQEMKTRKRQKFKRCERKHSLHRVLFFVVAVFEDKNYFDILILCVYFGRQLLFISHIYSREHIKMYDFCCSYNTHSALNMSLNFLYFGVFSSVYVTIKI